MDDLFTLESLESAGIVQQADNNTSDVEQQAPVQNQPETPPVDNIGEVVDNVAPIEEDQENVEQEEHISKGDFSESLNPFANFLAEQGFVSLKDDEGNDVEIKDFEDLASRMKSEIEKNRYGDLNDAQRRYMEALEHGIPLNDVEQLEREFNMYNTYNEDFLKADIQQRFNVVYQDQLDKGMSEDEANKMANIIIKDETLSMASATRYIEAKKQDVLSRYDKIKNATVEQNKVTIETLEKTISKKEDFLGVPLTDDFKKKVTKSMTTRAGQNAKGVPLNAFDKWREENGPDAEVILHALMLYTDNFKQLNRVEQRVKSTAVADLENTLRKNTGTKFKDKNATSIKIGGSEFTLL